MNRYSAYPHRIPGGLGYWAMIRLCRDAHPAPVMDAGDKPKVFSSKGDAAEECLRHIVAFMNGRPIRGEKYDLSPPSNAARAKAEMFFAGKGKTVQVEQV